MANASKKQVHAERIVVSGSFDDLKSRQIRFLEKASRLGEVHVLLWTDETTRALEGRPPKFPFEERRYLLQAVRYVSQIHETRGLLSPDSLPVLDGLKPEFWVVEEDQDNEQKRSYCALHGLGYRVIRQSDLDSFPVPAHETVEAPLQHKRVIVSGCFDWLHSGHVRFFEEVSQLGDLYVVLGSDANVRHLKGEGHPLFSQDERRYMVQSIRFVKRALISSGSGWLDAEPEIEIVRPHIYAVNEDGDKPEKRQYCEQHGIEYVVLKRIPKQGLPKREITILRGF